MRARDVSANLSSSARSSDGLHLCNTCVHKGFKITPNQARVRKAELTKRAWEQVITACFLKPVYTADNEDLTHATQFKLIRSCLELVF